MRHKVGAENGRGATSLSGFFGLRTSCDSRSQALSGSLSKVACVGAVDAAGRVAVGLMMLTGMVGLLLKLKPFDISSVLMKVDGVNVLFCGLNVTAIAVLFAATAVSTRT